MQTVDALCRHAPKSRLQTDTNFLRAVTCSTILALHKKRSAYVLLWNVSGDTRKMLQLAVNTARILLKNAALMIGFAVDRWIPKVPFEICIHEDTVHSVFSAMLVGENRLSPQEIAAPCLTMCRLHFYANAHNATNSQVRTLRKSCSGCAGNKYGRWWHPWPQCRFW